MPAASSPCSAVADPRVAVHPGDRRRLRDADAARVERFGEAGDVVGGLREAPLRGHVGVRPVARGAQVALHRAVAVGQIRLAPFCRRHRHRQLRVDPPVEELEAADPFVEFCHGGIDELVGDLIDRPVGPAGDLVEELGVHGPNPTEGV